MNCFRKKFALIVLILISYLLLLDAKVRMMTNSHRVSDAVMKQQKMEIMGTTTTNDSQMSLSR